MLHRSFKSAKCKTALKLAVSRIKLLKNKREAQVRQLKRELAKLLESGQDQTARIRVEHVVREEKTMAAYDLIEIYCELIAARLPMIEAQKICPIDLKEAISSVIFASPRCSDIPELMDVRKHITAKYGKEFISAAVELRPDCGLVEKLSAKAPDGPTKIKILTAIAEEHNVKWEPKSFGESDAKSSQDSSQVGPNTYEKDTYVEHPQVHVPPVRDEKGPPNIHASSQHKMQDVSANLDKKATFAHKNVGGNKSATSNRSNPEIRSSGIGNQEMGSTNSHSENRRDISMGRKNWNMEFTDAASAAQAAAESAERASMAARAAAELSNREKITRQYSKNRDYLDEVSMEKQASRTEVDFGSQLHGDVSTENTDHFGYGRTDRQFSKGSSSAHFITSDDHNVLNLNGGPMMGKNTVGNLFVTDEESTQRDFPETNFYNDTAVVFDDSASEDDEYRFVLDETYGEQGSGSFSASGNKSQIDPLANRNDWSPGHVTEEEGGFSSQSHEDLLPVTFDDSDGPSSESEEDLVKSKGSGSYGYGNSVPDQSARSHGALGSSPRYDKNVDSDRKKFGSSSSLAVSDTVEEHIKGKIDINNVPEKNLGYDDLPSSKQSSKGRSSVLGSNLKTTVLESESPDTSNVTETLEESHVERGKELKYETLKGGLRNKGYTRPPYLKSSADKVSSLSGDISVENEQTLPSARTYLSSESRGQDTYVRKASRVNKSRGVREHIASSDSDNYDLVQNSQETMTSGIQKEENEVSKKSSSRATINYFDSDSASEDEIPKQINSVSLSRPVGGFSRRTTASSKSGAGLGWKSPNERGNQEMASSRMKPIPESNRSSQPSSALPKTVTPENAEASVSSNSSSKDNAYASHVHPKLPDYDSFAAHFLSLRKGRQ
ncbi:dentin sialophosphoprotein-like isoform X1 [Senna tora]|uniref:Dentin sialophosphoprotein-like isoform X1 n=1 Tax=Senna tora TaxID=362788 RepID=A0A834W987_9FABA|nr:dentin sialophosphoprotein-like isoform X1 [Senna tora]